MSSVTRPLVTGGGGFAGRHLLAHLRERGDVPAAPSHEELGLLDADAVRGAVADAQPDAVFHLAALASVSQSWSSPQVVLTDNLTMTLNLLEAVRLEAPQAALLMAGTGEVYGLPDRLPVKEAAPLRPQNPYAVSKAACELLAGQYADAYGLRVVRARAFNHAGPGQSEEYLIGTLTRQVAEAEAAGEQRVVLRTGNVDSRRDFTDVRDVVRAYAGAAGLEPDVYNICSERTVSAREVIDLLSDCTRLEIGHEVDEARMRPHDVPEIRGSAERLREASGWSPEVPLERTVADALDAWRQRLPSA